MTTVSIWIVNNYFRDRLRLVKRAIYPEDGKYIPIKNLKNLVVLVRPVISNVYNKKMPMDAK